MIPLFSFIVRIAALPTLLHSNQTTFFPIDSRLQTATPSKQEHCTLSLFIIVSPQLALSPTHTQYTTYNPKFLFLHSVNPSSPPWWTFCTLPFFGFSGAFACRLINVQLKKYDRMNVTSPPGEGKEPPWQAPPPLGRGYSPVLPFARTSPTDPQVSPTHGPSDRAPEESGSTTQEQSWSRRRATVV